MMMTLKANTTNSISQPIHYNINEHNHLHSTIGYNYHQSHNSWEKPIYNNSTFNYQQTPYTYRTISSTGDISSIETINKLNNSYPSYDLTTNFNNSTQNFYRRHTESTLPISNSIYSTNHSSSNIYNNNNNNYSHPTIHYHPSELFFNWNNGSSLMRTHSNTSYQDYSQSTPFPCYNPIDLSTSQSTINNKSIDNLSLNRTQTESINTHSTNNYSSFFNIIQPINTSLISTQSSNSILHQKQSKPSIKKRPRLTAQLRNEILKLKDNQPTVFVWEIQQILLQNGICTAQTLPSAKVIQRVLNESKKSIRIIKEEPKANVNLVMETIFNNIENKKTSPITICLSPSQSSTLSDNESISECSICLETYRSGQEVSILSCSHEYHSSCIKGWMMKNRSCPMCRKDIHNQPQFVTLLI
ncbi:unnamed protein product [Rotaria sp. Silwood1]|nr:unnamed protein product [Rotaria sp. Silwood1]